MSRGHEGLALSPYLFSLIIYEITKDIQSKVPWCMMFADDIVIVGEGPEGEIGIVEKSTVREGTKDK